MEGNNNVYYILTNPLEISLYNALNKYRKLSENFYSVNAFKVYQQVINFIIGNHDLSTINDLLDNLEYDNSADITTHEIYWDPNYVNESLDNFINQVKVILSTNNNFENFSRNLLLEESTIISNYLQDIYENNLQYDLEIETLKSKIEDMFNANDNYRQKYNEEYQSITKKFTDYKTVKSVKSKILSILNCEETKTDDPIQKKNYYILVGNKKTITQEINYIVNQINSLYSLLINIDICQSELIFAKVVSDFVQRWKNGRFFNTNKPEALELSKSELYDYINASSEVQSKVDILVNNIKDSYDSEYPYTDIDIQILNNIINDLELNYNTIIEENQNVQNQINNKLSTLEQLKEEYRNNNDGEDYPHNPINDNQSQEGNYVYVSSINNVYSKSYNMVNNIIPSETNINLSVGDEHTITLTYQPTNHQSFTINDLVVTCSNTNITIDKTIDTITIHAINSGTCTITIQLNNVSTTITVNVEAVTQSYYFYLGNNENQVISNDYIINPSSLQTYNNIEDILGNHTFDSAQYVLVPEVWYSQIKFKNAQNMPLDADVYRVNIGTTNYILIEGYESWADLLVLELDPNNQGGLDTEIVDKTNYTEQTIYYYYAGWTLPSTSNVDTIINETYPTSSSDNTQHPAGKKTTTKSSMDYTQGNLYYSTAKTYYYVLVPSNHAIYDSLGNNVIESTFILQETITVGNQIHNIYKSNGTSRNIGAIIIR